MAEEHKCIGKDCAYYTKPVRRSIADRHGKSRGRRCNPSTCDYEFVNNGIDRPNIVTGRPCLHPEVFENRDAPVSSLDAV